MAFKIKRNYCWLVQWRQKHWKKVGWLSWLSQQMDTGYVSQSLKSNHKVDHKFCQSLVLVKRSKAALNLEYLDSHGLEQKMIYQAKNQLKVVIDLLDCLLNCAERILWIIVCSIRHL